MNNYVKTSVPRPVGNPGNGINPKDVLTLIDIDDLVYFPPRDGAGVVLEGDIVVKPSAYSTDLYLTPGTVELSSNGEGETDAKGFTPSVKGKHPGNKQEVREFKTNWLGRHCIAILQYCNGQDPDILGSPCNPLEMSVNYTGNKDGNASEFTFTQISKGDDIGIYKGTIPRREIDLISAAWEPKKGDMIRLMKRQDGKFIELGRETGATGALQFPDDEATPSLQGGDVFVTGANTTPTAITNFTDAVPGKTYTIHGNGDKNASTIAAGGNFVLTSEMTLGTGKFIRLVKADDGKFYEVARG